MSGTASGFSRTRQAVRTQLRAMPWTRYEIRLIHQGTQRPYPGWRCWTAGQLLEPARIGFLRIRNQQGHDIYLRPFAGASNAGYILVDLDQPEPTVVETMGANGHPPCVVLESSPGRWQAWVRVSLTPLEPAVASRIGQQFARLYGADRASADWRHLGRLAGFTNRKPDRCLPGGLAPWVKVLAATGAIATQAITLVQAATQWVAERAAGQPIRSPAGPRSGPLLRPPEAVEIYQDWLDRLQIRQRYPETNWSIADAWVARALLGRHHSPAAVAAVLRAGSPGFPRRHPDPEDYLRRTIAHAVQFSGNSFS